MTVLPAAPAQTVVTVTLDWMLDYFPAPQVLKIDVEGLEYAVLPGAWRVLQSRPPIFCEVTERHDLVGELLRGADYEFYAARTSERQSLHRRSRDTLAVPKAHST